MDVEEWATSVNEIIWVLKLQRNLIWGKPK
jgi:hypothetical protein